MPISKLIKDIEKKLEDLEYPTSNVSSDLKSIYTLKEIICNDEICENIIKEDNHFESKLPMNEYNQMIYNDFSLGYKRYQAHKKELLEVLVNTNGSLGWFIVTLYYAAFFGVNEINKLLGLININLDKDEKESLISNAKGKLEEFKNSESSTFVGEIKLDLDNRNVLIKFKPLSNKPHVYTWNNFNSVFSKGLKNKDMDKMNINRINRINLLKNILKGNNNWIIPSKIRNDINYKLVRDFTLNKKSQSYYSYLYSAIKKESNFLKFADSRPSATEDNIYASLGFLFKIIDSTLSEINRKILILKKQY